MSPCSDNRPYDGEWQQSGDEARALLCELMRQVETNWKMGPLFLFEITPEMAAWWERHKKLDKARS